MYFGVNLHEICIYRATTYGCSYSCCKVFQYILESGISHHEPKGGLKDSSEAQNAHK